MDNNVRPHQAGQGLIETLMIILLVAVSIVVFIKFQHYMSYSSEVTHQQGDATIIASSQLETLRDFSVLNVTSGYTAYASIVTGSNSSTVGNTTFTVNWTVTSYTSPTYKNIAVTVTWTDRQGNNNSLVLITNVAGIDPGGSVSVM